VVLGAACAKHQTKTEAVEVVTTLDVLAHWVRAVGGDRVHVQSLLSGYEDPHNFEPRPADAERIARAKLLVRVGLGLEEWLDGLVANSGNRALVSLDAAEGVEVIGGGHEQHAEHGHSHEQGNPHVWLDPENAGSAVLRIAAELGRLDPKGESLYTARARAYSARLDSLSTALKAEVAALPDRRFVGFHDAWPYFNRRFGFEAVANIEPVPGQEPSARRLAELVDLVRRERIRVVVTEPQLASDLPNTLARETGARVVVLNALRADSAGADRYIGLIEQNVRRLAAALED
jgi:ABC-type Zn uptake system ZnuABC Zn-binding protein ZnuA